jgi:glycosyltransferase involved in cell wall biosynthesis
MSTVLWIAPDIRVMGGISTVLRGWLEMGIDRRHRVIRIASHQDGSRARKLFRAVTGLRQTARTVTRTRVDIAHVHGGDTLSFRRKYGFIRLVRRLSPETRILYHHHGADFMAQYPSLPGFWRRRVRETLTDADRVICLSDSWIRRLRDIAPGGRFLLLPNGVPIPRIPVDPSAGGPLRVLFLGRIGDRKGVFDLLEAVASLLHSGVDLRLDIGGNGEIQRLRSAIARRGLADRARFHGWIRGPEKDRLMRKSGLLALPSRAEGMPMTLLEAMALGLPVLATPVGGVPELVRHGENGLLAPPGDRAALAAGLRRLTDPSLRKELGRKARETVQRDHDLSRLVRRLDRLYESLGPAAGI